jgi:hypothetical protein
VTLVTGFFDCSYAIVVTLNISHTTAKLFPDECVNELEIIGPDVCGEKISRDEDHPAF